MTPRRRALLLTFVGVLLLGFSGTRHAGLVSSRGAHELQAVPPEETTPLVAITTVAFGAFRGLVADALWMRAYELQEQGQYFELVQLAAWITQLEPNIPEVWVFQAWNLAYNISVLFPEDEDRWRWVRHGLELLREDGLRHNPVSAQIHWEIGWILQHKVGMDYDQSHLHYKARLAQSVQEAFGGPRPQDDAAWERATRDFRMTPTRMQALESQFGPLDWRLPHTHVLYWADRGLPLARDGFNQSRLRRMRQQALAEIMRRGRLIVDDDGQPILSLPRLDLLPRILTEMEQPGRDTLSRQGQRAFLIDAIILFAEYGQLETALDLSNRLHRIDPDHPAELPGLESLLQQHAAMPETQFSRDQAIIRITALLAQARSWETHDPTRARGFRSMAAQTHRRYQAARFNPEHARRTGLPPFEKMESAVRQFVQPGDFL